MLSELRVRDLGVIEDLTLRLGPGMTALTGETGAGKTLLVEALALVLGGRASPGLVRAGAEEAVVEARFVLEGAGDEEGAEVIVARTVPVAGRSRATIDGRMAPVTALVELAPRLADIHGQHEQQSLGAPSAQRRALDAFAGTDLAPLEAARRQVVELEDRLTALGGDAAQRAREVDMLAHQVREIDDAALDDPDEEEHLLAEEARLADLEAHREAAAAALAQLDGAAGDGGALVALGVAAAQLSGRSPFDAWEARLRASLADVGDVTSDLRHVVEHWEDDPERLAAVQERRRTLADLRRKYGGTLADVVTYGELSRKRLAQLEADEGRAEVLGAELVEARDRLAQAEEAVGRTRRAAAPELARAAGRRLQDLAMAGARFEIEVGPGGSGEAVRFLLGANPGEPVQPLGRVASGGELARAMLALRLVALEGPATMVFDEVDAGVGGAAALALAAALREVGAERQVLVVTHLAQVAAFADHQVAVRKVVREGRTTTEATPLDAEGRVVEVSRMLSGHPDSPTARAHAAELLELAGRTPPSTTGSGGVV